MQHARAQSFESAQRLVRVQIDLQRQRARLPDLGHRLGSAHDTEQSQPIAELPGESQADITAAQNDHAWSSKSPRQGTCPG